MNETESTKETETEVVDEVRVQETPVTPPPVPAPPAPRAVPRPVPQRKSEHSKLIIPAFVLSVVSVVVAFIALVIGINALGSNHGGSSYGHHNYDRDSIVLEKKVEKLNERIDQQNKRDAKTRQGSNDTRVYEEEAIERRGGGQGYLDRDSFGEEEIIEERGGSHGHLDLNGFSKEEIKEFFEENFGNNN